MAAFTRLRTSGSRVKPTTLGVRILTDVMTPPPVAAGVNAIFIVFVASNVLGEIVLLDVDKQYTVIVICGLRHDDTLLNRLLLDDSFCQWPPLYNRSCRFFFFFNTN